MRSKLAVFEMEIPSKVDRLLNADPLSDTQLEQGIRILRNGNGWIRALGDARAIVARALTELEFLPENSYRQALTEIAAHLVNQGFLDSYGTE